MLKLGYFTGLARLRHTFLKMSHSLINSVKAPPVRIVDEDWRQAHLWAAEFRRRHGMTIHEFLNFIEAEPRSSYVQYLCKSGLVNFPSNKSGTMGKMLREAVGKAKIFDAGLLSPYSMQSFNNRIHSFLQEFVFEGHSCVDDLIINVTATNETERFVELACAGVSTDVDVKPQLQFAIQEYLSEKLRAQVTVHVKEYSTLLRVSHTSVACINVLGCGCGTATVVRHPCGVNVALTAKHVICHGNSFDTYHKRSSLNGKYLKDESVDIFGYSAESLLNSKSDVAVVVCFLEHVLCSVIEHIGSVRLPTLQELRALEKLLIASPDQFILAKNGCATGVTTSVITEVSDNSFTVANREVGPVAFHGDSGALWIIIQSPQGLYNQIILGICSHIKVVPEIIGQSTIHQILCVNAPIWVWYDWFVEEIADTLMQETNYSEASSLDGETVVPEQHINESAHRDDEVD